MIDRALSLEEQRIRANDLLDVYAGILTDKQRNAVSLYFRDDLSLSEVADQIGISRQAVHDSIHRSLRAMEEADAKIGGCAREQRLRTLEKFLIKLKRERALSQEMKDAIAEVLGEY